MPKTYRLAILDTISDAGKPGRANEDRFGDNGTTAFVIDGATGLGDRQFMTRFGSDAAWMADFAADRVRQDLGATANVRAVIRDLSTSAAEYFRAAAGVQPRYAWPLAALACLRATPDGFQFIGLGDSCLYHLPDHAHQATVHMAIADAYEREQAAARLHVERRGSIGANGIANDDPQTLAELRRHRALQNTEGGEIWTLGLVPETADHLTVTPLAATPATALLCSDGIADLVALYGAYDGAGLVRAAMQKGLAALVTELRHFERDIDPDGLRYPRFKQSDDATAMLLRLTID